MKILKLPLLACLFAIGFTACESDPLGGDNNPDPTPTATYTSINELLEDMAPPVQTFGFDADDGGVFTTPRGSQITIPSSAFVGLNGQPISGNVQLEFQEIFTRTDMMTTGVTTVSNNALLNSGGAYTIDVTQNGQSLAVAPNASIEVRIPEQAVDPGMQIFVGQNLGTGSNNTWQLPDSATTFNFLRDNGFYQITSQYLGWVNCDAFYQAGILDPIHFDLLGVQGLDYTNTIIFGYAHGINNLFNPWKLANASFVNSQMRNYRLPNVNQTIIVLTLKQGQFYYGTLNINPPVAGTTYAIQMNAVTQADIQNFLANL
ncbi:hypothetical protein [Phaeocystidibacter luteus]|uniref:Uncharacterized protein n=1 Tax=Phaeocystidibacter luteus TaxID=911197 RepID=A0A6N6RGU6_9FLAO|nr:hypothetical protein [Phaeocystidibacter luteus]KAB2810396.1 hypothetical protein F8C67_07350 [Phaeocystidibacter luteus]